MKLVFWVSVALILHTYVIYPILLVVLAGLWQLIADLRFAVGRQNRRRHAESAWLPTVSILFAAHNEEAEISRKMKNCAAVNYPPDRVEVLVGCDGCTDRTAELARAAGLPNARVFDFPCRSGKPATLNLLRPAAAGEILIFSDANTMLDPGVVRSLVRHFSDPRVGAVCGELRLASTPEGPRSEGLYWRYEVFLKFLESRLNMMLGANGAVLAIRGALFSPLPLQAIVDDFVLAMRIRAQGYRVVYDPEAVAREYSAGSVREEFRRRTRIGAGNFHALRFTWKLLLPTAGLVAFSYWSHKVFRWLVPFAICSVFLSATVLSREAFYAASAVSIGAMAGLALIGFRLEQRQIHRSAFSLPYYFLAMNLALLLGFVGFLTGRQTTVWRRTAREPVS